MLVTMVVHVRRQMLQISLAAVPIRQVHQLLMVFVQVFVTIIRDYVLMLSCLDPCSTVVCNYGGSCSSSTATDFTCSCPHSSSTSVTDGLCAGTFANCDEPRFRFVFFS
jgi:hypothetical protein